MVDVICSVAGWPDSRDRAAHSADAVEACIHSISWHRRLDACVLLGFAEPTNDLGLPVRCNIAIARKFRQHVLVAEVLGPSLVLLGRLADVFAQKG
jgi:hypothetical protein